MADVAACTVSTLHDGYGGGKTYNPQPYLIQTTHTPPYGVASLGEGLPPRLPPTHTLRHSDARRWARYGIP